MHHDIRRPSACKRSSSSFTRRSRGAWRCARTRRSNCANGRRNCARRSSVCWAWRGARLYRRRIRSSSRRAIAATTSRNCTRSTLAEAARMPVYLLRPKTPPPWKPVIVFHGHDPSVQYILGNYPDEPKRNARAAVALDNDYARALARQGYLVCAPEQRGFGARVSDQRVATKSCRHLAFSYLLEGRTLLGERCRDGMQAIDWLLAREDVAPGVLGATGNSGGGTTTLWLAAIDQRITVAAPSCYFCSFKDSLLDIVHCECNLRAGHPRAGRDGRTGRAAGAAPAAHHRRRARPHLPRRRRARAVQNGGARLGPGRRKRAPLAGRASGRTRLLHHAAGHDWFRRWL